MSDSQEAMSSLSHITTDEDPRPSLPAVGRFPELNVTEHAGTSIGLPPLAAPRPALGRMLLPWPAIAGGGLAMVLALGVLSIYALPDRRTDSPSVSQRLIASGDAAPAVAAASEPVRFANPFDRDEVFEFPAGTSESEARDEVAELLKTRATERSEAGLLPKAVHQTRRASTDHGHDRNPHG